MSTVDGSIAIDTPYGDARERTSYLNAGSGPLSWLLTLDHKRIGIMYLVGIMIAFLAGGLFALLVRTELVSPGKTIVDAEWYNQFFTLHGALMVFVVIIPGIPAALGNFALPIMLGAKDVAFPRLNLASWYMWLFGALFLVSTLVLGGVDTGWTFYTPYSTKFAMSGMIPAVTGAFILGFSSIFTGLNFIVTIHKLRRPEMTWMRMPLFVWGLYATAIIQVLATPVLGITLLLLLVERLLGVGFFRPDLGGDPVLFQHFFWFYSHPAVYIMILPAMGAMSELITCYSHKHIFGYKYIAGSSVAIAVISFIVWGHHMFVAGQSALVAVIFSFLTYAVAIPSAIKMFNWLATLYKASISFKAPMLFALSFMWIFGIGGLTGLFLATLAVDVHLHDTYFVVAHFHYVMAGTIFVFFGALFHWWPKITGRMYTEWQGQVSALLLFVGFNVTFFTQFFLGLLGMPRRYYDYSAMLPYHPEFHLLHAISSTGSYIMGVGVILMVYCLITSLKRGRRAPDNPWGGATLEWRTTSPPPVENFKKVPWAGDPYDYHAFDWDERVGGYVYNGDAEDAQDRAAFEKTHPDAHPGYA